jgi:hypothetical protein
VEIWNREELYEEVWSQPLVKVAPKYGISAVAIGKVCRKLQIPLPGRGYWVRKQFGKVMNRIPLPEGKDVPVVERLRFPTSQSSNLGKSIPEEVPTDPDFLRIVSVESREIALDPKGERHKLVTGSEKVLKRTRPDEKGLLTPRYDEDCLDVCVSPAAVERTLIFLNAVILCLEREGFPVTVEKGRRGTSAQIFGYRVPFAIVEKLRQKSRRQVQEYSWTRTVVDYEPTGTLEFHVGDYAYGHKFRDRKKQTLEKQLSDCVGALLREGHSQSISAKNAAKQKLIAQAKERVRAELAQRIADEEKKVRDLDRWVSNWIRAQQMRDFIVALENVWTREGHDLSTETEKGQRITWMKHQADRLDPMLPSPPSILDRKNEIDCQ